MVPRNSRSGGKSARLFSLDMVHERKSAGEIAEIPDEFTLCSPFLVTPPASERVMTK